MDYLIWGIISVIILLLLIIFLVLLRKGKIEKRMNYRSLFILGIILFPVGLAVESYGIWALAIIYTILGLANKKKWGEQRPSWSELTPEQRRLKIILIVILGIIFLAGLAVYFLCQ